MIQAGICLTALTGCFPPYEPVSQDSREEIKFSQVQIEQHQIFFAESGDASDPLVLFIHGTPGSWQGYARYLQDPVLRSQAHLVAVDRPGFGRSGTQLPGFREQASILMQVAQVNHSGAPVVLVGHSLGGSLAYRMAVDYPDKIAGVVVISSSIDPDLGGARWYNQLASYSLLAWAVPEGLLRANQEIMPLGEELAILAPLLNRITSPVSVIHGTQDKLVDFRNLEFARKSLTHANVRIVPVERGGHFLLWDQPEIVVREIVALLSRSED